MTDFLTVNEVAEEIKKVFPITLITIEKPMVKLAYGKCWLIVGTVITDWRGVHYARFSCVKKFRKWLKKQNGIKILVFSIAGVTDEDHYNRLIENTNKNKSYDIKVVHYDRKPPKGSLKYRLKYSVWCYHNKEKVKATVDLVNASFGKCKTEDVYVVSNSGEPRYGRSVNLYVNMKTDEYLPMALMYLGTDHTILEVYTGE